MRDIMRPAVRRYLYGIAAAAVPLTIALGYVTDELAPLVLAAVAAVLGFPLAAANTPPGGE